MIIIKRTFIRCCWFTFLLYFFPYHSFRVHITGAALSPPPPHIGKLAARSELNGKLSICSQTPTTAAARRRRRHGIRSTNISLNAWSTTSVVVLSASRGDWGLVCFVVCWQISVLLHNAGVQQGFSKNPLAYFSSTCVPNWTHVPLSFLLFSILSDNII